MHLRVEHRSFELNGILGTGFHSLASAQAAPNPILAYTTANNLPRLFSACFAVDGGVLGVGEVRAHAHLRLHFNDMAALFSASCPN